MVTGWQNVNGNLNAHVGSTANGRGYEGAGVAGGRIPGAVHSQQFVNGRVPTSPVIDNSAVNVGQMQDSRRILATFPFASSTPSGHGMHLSANEVFFH